MFKKRKINTNSQRPTKLAEKKNELDAQSEKEASSDVAISSVVKKSDASKLLETSSKSEDATAPTGSKRRSSENDGKQEEEVSADDEGQKSTVGVFNGKLNVANFINISRDGHANKFGPLKASTHIRSTTMTDYAPDVCKDYKQSGFCGYGDSCKFLHIREDYAAGWKIDKEWEIKQAGLATDKPEEEKKEESPKIPTECPICSKPYKSPVVSQCDHFFCETCFLSEFRKSPTCFVCQAKTSGTVKPASKLLKEKLAAQS